MGRVLYLATFHVRDTHREVFLVAARTKLKPWWEAHGAETFEVYQEVGPAGPTGRLTQAWTFPDRDAYLRMRSSSDAGAPTDVYRFLSEPEFRVLELIVP